MRIPVALFFPVLAATLAAQSGVGGSVPAPAGERLPPPRRADPDEPPVAITTGEAPREHAASTGGGPRPGDADRAHFRIELAFAGGNFEHDTADVGALQDDTDGGYFRLGFEYIGEHDFGGGLRLEGSTSDDDLFVSSGGVAAEASDAELFLHATALFRGEDIDAPLRFGLSFRGYALQETVSGDEVTWSSFGPRIEVEPDIQLYDGTSVRWSAYGKFGVFAGLTTIESDPATFEWDSTMTGVDVGIGTRLTWEHVQFGVGYLLRTHQSAESDVTSSLLIRAFDAEFSGLELSLALLF